jgi:hypothetical protein
MLKHLALFGYLAVLTVLIVEGSKRRGPAEIIPFPARTQA